MTDIFSKEKRSAIMREVHSRNTKPELLIRSHLHRIGYRYRLYDKKLPGSPDLAFSSRKKVIFINGCFWHGHNCKRGKRIPKSNFDYWKKKIEGNKARDKVNYKKLGKQGWEKIVIWECQLNDIDKVIRRVITFLDGST